MNAATETATADILAAAQMAADAARDAARNIMELAGVAQLCGVERVRCYGTTKMGAIYTFGVVVLQIAGYRAGDALRGTHDDKAIKAAIAAAAAEVDAPLVFEVR